MTRHPHLILRDTGETKTYTSTSGGSNAPFRTPPRDDRREHGTRLISSMRAAAADAEQAPVGEAERSEGITLEFESDAGFALKVESLERQRSGIELVNVREEDERMFATVFVPTDKVTVFVRQFERYVNENAESGAPKKRAAAGGHELARGKDVWGHHEMTKATPFQLSLLEDLKPGVDYSTYADDVASAVHFPRWFYRQQKQPEVTLRSMASKGLLHRRIVRAGEYFKIPVYRLPTSEPA